MGVMKNDGSKRPTGISRREVTNGLAAAALALPLLPAFDATAAPLAYNLAPVKVRDGVWVVIGAQEAITARNGGAIANIGIVDTADGAVIIDSGPSKRFGLQLLALARELTGKDVVRTYITHFHPDHVFGNQAFGKSVVAAPQAVVDGLKAMGEDFSSAMYYIAGDWMRGTNVVLPETIISDGVEDIGGRKFHLSVLAGHTACDLVVFEETSGIMFAGDLVFLDRAPTTPHANLDVWRASLARLDHLAGGGDLKVVPGHGPVHAPWRGREQTLRWLETIETQIRDCFERGMTATEAIAQPLPEWTRDVALAAYEYERSVLHLFPKLEAGSWPRVDTQRG